LFGNQLIDSLFQVISELVTAHATTTASASAAADASTTTTTSTSVVVWPTHVAELVYHKVYQGFMEAIDGIDNGVNVQGPNGKLMYRVSTDLSSRVGHLHPRLVDPSCA
jgi:uncharacterized UPF0160 family protein